MKDAGFDDFYKQAYPVIFGILRKAENPGGCAGGSCARTSTTLTSTLQAAKTLGLFIAAEVTHNRTLKLIVLDHMLDDSGVSMASIAAALPTAIRTQAFVDCAKSVTPRVPHIVRLLETSVQCATPTPHP